MRRVVVFGTTGSGKSTVAMRLAEQTGLRVIELDALFWGRDWQPAPVELFRHRVEREVGSTTPDEGGWIVVGNYGQVRDIVWQPADTLIWLDLPLPLVMWRLLGRTIRRIATQEELWGTGNRESLRNAFFSRDSILLWALKTHRRNRKKYALECEFLAGEKQVVRLKSTHEVERFVAGA
jgi:adenylate kinase family enzyme